MLMSNMKTIGVFVVIFCCFAVLYPKIFHPMILQIFGLGRDQERGSDGLPRHPREGNPNRPMPQPPRNPTMRQPGVHPGMRAAAEMRKQAGEQGGGNKGMINMVLPMYAVGIVIYLVYTMAKVFMRNKKSDEPGPFQSKTDFYRSSSYKDDAGPYFNYPTEAMDEETRFLLSKREKLEELEQLLAKAELKQINDNEMVTLRARLEETESQMSRILKAMEHVQTRVKDGIDAHLEARARPQAGGAKGGPKTGAQAKGAHAQGPKAEKSAPQAEAGPAKPAPSKAEPKKQESTEVEEDASDDKPSQSKTSPLNTDLNALDSESSGRESDDELSDDEDEGDEDDDVEGNYGDEEEEEEEEEDEDSISDEEKGIRQINGMGRLDINPTDNDVMQHLSRQHDLIPDSDSDGALRGDVMNDVDTGSDVEFDGVIETLGAKTLPGDSDDGLDLGLRQRKNVS